MIYLVIIPLALMFVPWLLVRFIFKTQHTANLAYSKHAWLLVTASLTWVGAMTLPNVAIASQTETTTMHTLGGVVAALLFIYAVRVYQIQFRFWWQSVLALYFFVCGLGVLNELFELFLFKIGVPGVIGGDEWWDLAANTFGAYLAYLIARLTRQL